MGRTRDFTVDVVEPLPPVDGDPARYTLLTQETVLMTVLAQDPSVVDRGGPVRAGVAVPGRAAAARPAGPPLPRRRRQRRHRERPPPPVVLHDGDRWTYRDRWDRPTRDPDAAALVARPRLPRPERLRRRGPHAGPLRAAPRPPDPVALRRPAALPRAPGPASRPTRSTPASTTPSSSAGSPRSWAGPRSTPRCPTT